MMAQGDIVKTYRSREEIACEINLIKGQVLRTVLQGAIDVGRLLCEAKEVVPHGEWGAWLEENVDYSTTKANDLMRIYREYNDDQVKLFGRSNEELYGRLSMSQALELLAIPAPEREKFVEENDVESMSTRDLREQLRELKKELEEAANDVREAEMARDVGRELVAASERREKEAKESAAAAAKRAEAAQKKAEKALADAKKEAERAKREAESAREKLKAAESEVEQLHLQIEEKLEEKVVERIVEQLPADYHILREDNERLTKQLMMSDKTVSEIGLLLEDLQRVDSAICDRLEDVKSPDVREKLESAVGRIVASFGGVESKWQRVDEAKVICGSCNNKQMIEQDEHAPDYCACCGAKMQNGGMLI